MPPGGLFFFRRLSPTNCGCINLPALPLRALDKRAALALCGVMKNKVVSKARPPPAMLYRLGGEFLSSLEFTTSESFIEILKEEAN